MDNRLWMYDMYYENDGRLKSIFIDGVRSFIDHAMTLDSFKRNQLVRCPCSACSCLKFFSLDEVIMHLYRKGFKPRYFVWVDHGEIDGQNDIFYNSMPVDEYNMLVPHGQIRFEADRNQHDTFQHDRVHEMINDAFRVQGGMEPDQFFNEAPMWSSRSTRNDEGDSDPMFPLISIFNQSGRGSKGRGRRSLTNMEYQSTTIHILLNCPEIQSYLEYQSGLEGIGSSRQAEALDQVQLAAMSQKIEQLSSAFATSKARRVEQQKEVVQIKEQVLNLAGRPVPHPSTPEYESDDDEFVENSS